MIKMTMSNPERIDYSYIKSISPMVIETYEMAFSFRYKNLIKTENYRKAKYLADMGDRTTNGGRQHVWRVLGRRTLLTGSDPDSLPSKGAD